MERFVIGDMVKGCSDNYGITNTSMLKAKVIGVDEESIHVRIMKHTCMSYFGDTFWVNAKGFCKNWSCDRI